MKRTFKGFIVFIGTAIAVSWIITLLAGFIFGIFGTDEITDNTWERIQGMAWSLGLAVALIHALNGKFASRNVRACGKCQAEIEADSNFCNHCGEKQNNPATDTPK